MPCGSESGSDNYKYVSSTLLDSEDKVLTSESKEDTDSEDIGNDFDL